MDESEKPIEKPIETHPQADALCRELMKQYPHLDMLMASTIVWSELKKNPLQEYNGSPTNEKAIS